MAISDLSAGLAGFTEPLSFMRWWNTSTHKASTTGQPYFFNTHYHAGIPGAMAAPSPGMAGAALTSYAGLLPFPASGTVYLGPFGGHASVAGTLTLADRLWHNSGIVVTTTTAQTVNSVAFPARDINGATDGEGVLLALEVSAVLGNAGTITNTTATYTNSSNQNNRTATLYVESAMTLGGFIPFALQAGDYGVKSVESITLGTSYVSGTMHLVAYRPIAHHDVAQPYVDEPHVDLVTGCAPRLYADTCPMVLWSAISAATTAPNLSGIVGYAVA